LKQAICSLDLSQLRRRKRRFQVSTLGSQKRQPHKVEMKKSEKAAAFNS